MAPPSHYVAPSLVTANPIVGISHKQWLILGFGTIFAMDDRLAVAIERNSSEVGRAHGIYVNSVLDGFDLHLLMSFVFSNKEYNGSTLEIQGADRVFQKYREVSVVSGTGFFRFAHSYATLETDFLDIPNSNAIIRWNVTVFHYWVVGILVWNRRTWAWSLLNVNLI